MGVGEVCRHSGEQAEDDGVKWQRASKWGTSCKSGRKQRGIKKTDWLLCKAASYPVCSSFSRFPFESYAAQVVGSGRDSFISQLSPIVMTLAVLEQGAKSYRKLSP